MDQLFIHRLKVHDHEATGIFIDAFRDRVYDIAYRFTVDKTEALTIAEHVFVKILKDAEQFKADIDIHEQVEKNILAFLVDYLKDHYKINFIREIGRLFYRPPRRALENIGREELREKVLAIVSRIQDKSRAALLLHYYHGLKIKEMKNILGMNEASVRKTLQRAKIRITRKLRQEVE